jgi:mevalonate kinase
MCGVANVTSLSQAHSMSLNVTSLLYAYVRAQAYEKWSGAGGGGAGGGGGAFDDCMQVEVR